MKYLLEVFRSVVFFTSGAAILFALASISYSELLLDYRGIETDVKIDKTVFDASCGSRKSKRTCNQFTLDIAGKSIVHSSDDSKIYESKLIYLEGKPHIYRLGAKNKDPLNALMHKSFNIFPMFMLIMGIFALVSGFLGIKSCFSNKVIRYSIVILSVSASAFLGINILDFFE